MKTMRVLMLTLVLALCLALVSAQAEAPEDHLGEALPDFTVATIDGGTFTLSEALAEKEAVLINLWATWCGPCEMEFPYLEEAYEQYQDRVAVIALSVEPEDTDEVLTAYAEAHGMTFPIGNDAETGLGDIFATEGIPTSLVVDRFGNVAFIEVGSQTSTGNFTRVFDAFLGDDYTETTLLYEVPQAKPEVENADPADLAAALNVEGGEIAFRNADDEFVWPMLPAEKDGRDVVVSTNAGLSETTATVFADVVAEEGDALVFDFATSTEAAADLLAIDVDGVRVKAFGGAHDWTTWALPLEAGVHEIAFSYVKDYYSEAGEDAVWVDAVRLASGDEAAALLADLPVYPVGEDFSVGMMNEDAKEIVFAGDENGLLDEYFGCQSYWIVPGGVADVAAVLNGDVDPEAASFYSNYDGNQVALMECLDENGVYAFSSAIDSMAETGYSYTNVYVYPYPDVEDIEAIRGVMVFVDEENVNAFVEEMVEEGAVLTWSYADGSAPATDAVAEGESPMSVYTATFVDQDGNPVPGCVINFCTDESCQPVVADENGVAEFVGAPYAYHLQVIRVPAGYEFDTTQEFYAEEAGGDLTFTVKKS